MSKLTKIKFTAWCDHPDEPRSPYIQEQFEEWTLLRTVMSAAIARIKDQLKDSSNDELQERLAKANEGLANIEVELKRLLDFEEAAANKEQEKARRHPNVGRFGYQVLNDAGQVGKIVDENGADLPPAAVYSSEVVDADPPLPLWAKKDSGKR